MKNIQVFLGFANFYKRFINSFSRIIRFLVTLTRKEVRFFWLPACQTIFEVLKDTFILVLILCYFDLFKEIFVETNASDYVSLGVLS
jgi:hypothetical protein